MTLSRPNPGPSTPPPPPGPTKPGRGTAVTPARQDAPQAAVGPDEPAFRLPPTPPPPEFASGSAMYSGGRWST